MNHIRRIGGAGCAAILTAFVMSTDAALIISINVDEAQGRVPMRPSDLAGAPAVRVGNWNNYQASSTTITLAGVDLIYNDGTTVGGNFQVVISGPATWTTDDGSVNDRRMYRGSHAILSDGGTVSVTFNNVPFAEYDLYFYVMGQAASFRGGSIELEGGPIYYFRGGTAPNDDGTGYVELTTTTIGEPPVKQEVNEGNFISFRGLTSSNATVTTTAHLWGDNARAQVYGFQVVQVPEPAVSGMMALAGVLLWARRRRC